ncbi:MAG: biopolymer transporter ExbD [Deltaproteobacteria bacterium]|nr:biopolymer transporter ExbD [Kofleriaceae bacterium]
MAGGSLYSDGDDDAITDINVTPFVDVALVLMIIFMVTARLIVARGVEVEKPKSPVGDDLKGTILVTVDASATLYVMGEKQRDRYAARAAIEKLAKEQKEPRAIIAGDTKVAYGAIFMAIEVTKSAGVETIALANDPLPEGQIPVIPK